MLIESVEELKVARQALRDLAKHLEKNIRQGDIKGFKPPPGSRDINRMTLPVARRLLARLNSELDKESRP